MWLTGLSSSLKAFKHVPSKICCRVWPAYLEGGIPGVGNMCHRTHKTDHSQVCKVESKRCWPVLLHGGKGEQACSLSPLLELLKAFPGKVLKHEAVRVVPVVSVPRGCYR